MKYYEQLIDLGCFTRDNVEVLTGNRETAHSIIEAYKRKGLIEPVRRDLFVTISLETKQPVPNRYAIASKAASDAYVSYHSALEYHGIANQVFFEVYAASKSRFRTFEHDGLTYSHVASPIEEGVLSKPDGVSVTDLERTVVDGMDNFLKAGGLEELLRAIGMVPYLEPEKLIRYLDTYNKVFLFQKAGYILEHYKKGLKLPDEFFEACRSRLTKTKRYLFPGLQAQSPALNKDWQLYVPDNLHAITRKGANYVE